jgi:hypothetical protein
MDELRMLLSRVPSTIRSRPAYKALRVELMDRAAKKASERAASKLAADLVPELS